MEETTEAILNQVLSGIDALYEKYDFQLNSHQADWPICHYSLKASFEALFFASVCSGSRCEASNCFVIANNLLSNGLLSNGLLLNRG